MQITSLRKPLLPTHYDVWFDPPDDDGDEVLHVVSGRRVLKIKGRAFREFKRSVVPLLDGRHDLDAIRAQTSDVFAPDDLLECLEFLRAQGVVVEGDGIVPPDDIAARMAPQLNFFFEQEPDANLQARLTQATVAIIGLSGAGAATALTLGAAGVGTLRCADFEPVAKPDVYLSPFLGVGAIGSGRAAAVVAMIASAAPEVRAITYDGPLVSEENLREVTSGVDFIVCCLDAAQSNLIYKLNRICLADGLPWVSCALSGAEILVGPAMHPGAGPCYLCYRMRAVACCGNPEDAFEYEKQLDRRKRDDSGRRENLVFGAGIAANLLGLEVVKSITGMSEPNLIGRLLTIRLTDLAIERHTVLRKPWCPACFVKA